MLQVVFLLLAIVGTIEGTNYLFDDSLDRQVFIRGRIGALCFAVGTVGLMLLGVLT